MEAMLGKNGVASSSEHLRLHGLENLGSIHWNLSAPALYQEAIRRDEGVVTAGGALTPSLQEFIRVDLQRINLLWIRHLFMTT